MTSTSDLATIPLLTPTGRPASLEPFRGSWVVLHLVQSEARGAAVVAIGGSADYQARWLAPERGVLIPLLFAPDQRLHDAPGHGAPLGWRTSDPRGLASFARTMSHGYRPQRITLDPVRTPGVVILDPELVPRWRSVGRRIGDYPSHVSVEAALDSLVRRR